QARCHGQATRTQAKHNRHAHCPLAQEAGAQRSLSDSHGGGAFCPDSWSPRLSYIHACASMDSWTKKIDFSSCNGKWPEDNENHGCGTEKIGVAPRKPHP